MIYRQIISFVYSLSEIKVQTNVFIWFQFCNVRCILNSVSVY